MRTEDQTEVIEFLKCPSRYGAAGTAVILKTHISFIFLVGERVFKLKRALSRAYVDFSTRALRLAACSRELELNMRTAPMLYKAVRRITREENGELTFDGRGELVDAVVEMARFDEETLLDRIAARQPLNAVLLERLAHAIAVLHRDAPAIHDPAAAGRMKKILDINAPALERAEIFSSADIEALTGAFREPLRLLTPLLNSRGAAGKIRRCHGDLHLRNICLVDGAPVLFDCLEFNEELATIDVLYDIAFLVMDLIHRGHAEGGNLVFNRYLDECHETDGLPLMPFFLALRAAIRCHVAATQAGESCSKLASSFAEEARAYKALSLRFLESHPPRLIAIGGLSGAGKSTLAAGLAGSIGAPPGARVLSSDRIRKQMYGVSAGTRLPQDAYLPEVSRKVYSIMAEQAASILSGGHAVIADATFELPEDRVRIERSAELAGVPFDGFWIEAPISTRLVRVEKRRHDVSDATARTLRIQASRPHDTAGWRVIDAEGNILATLERLRRLLESG